MSVALNSLDFPIDLHQHTREEMTGPYFMSLGEVDVFLYITTASTSFQQNVASKK